MEIFMLTSEEKNSRIMLEKLNKKSFNLQYILSTGNTQNILNTSLLVIVNVS